MDAETLFKQKFHTAETPLKVYCPYRIAPVGAHSDYQHGLISGFAIDEGVTLAFLPTNDGTVKLYSANFEGAAEFSGGEGQRLMLARAFYKDAPLLVLDEPTAALDPLAESRLYERYRQFSENKTTVFISHRLASTRFCDRILLMENGEIAETGTHEELMRQQGSYARMYLLQSKYYQQEEAGLEGEMSL